VSDEPVRKSTDITQAARTARDVRYAGSDAPLHPLTELTQDPLIDRLAELGRVEPGSAAFSEMHMVGTMAPEAVIEVMGHVGAEGLGITHRLDGVTGEVIDTPNTLIRDWR
jgi:hypothetical protein